MFDVLLSCKVESLITPTAMMMMPTTTTTTKLALATAPADYSYQPISTKVLAPPPSCYYPFMITVDCNLKYPGVERCELGFLGWCLMTISQTCKNTRSHNFFQIPAGVACTDVPQLCREGGLTGVVSFLCLWPRTRHWQSSSSHKRWHNVMHNHPAVIMTKSNTCFANLHARVYCEGCQVSTTYLDDVRHAPSLQIDSLNTVYHWKERHGHRFYAAEGGRDIAA